MHCYGCVLGDVISCISAGVLSVVVVSSGMLTLGVLSAQLISVGLLFNGCPLYVPSLKYWNHFSFFHPGDSVVIDAVVITVL